MLLIFSFQQLFPLRLNSITVVEDSPNSFTGPKYKWSLKVEFQLKDDTIINVGKRVLQEEIKRTKSLPETFTMR